MKSLAREGIKDKKWEIPLYASRTAGLLSKTPDIRKRKTPKV